MTFPPVTWSEVEDHLLTRLMIDDEWCVRGQDSLTWWPWFLAQEFSITAEGTWDEDPNDNFLTVLAETQVARVSEEVGLALCAAANQEFALGTFVWIDGVISVVTSLSLNPLCRGLLNQFHEAALAQALVAHGMAGAWTESGYEVEVLASAHPTSGDRDEPDELLTMFAGSGRADGAQDLAEMPDVLEAARVVYRGNFERAGWTVVVTDAFVDVFDGPAGTITIGRLDDSEDATRYGRGLAVVVPITQPENPFSPELSNACAVAMLENANTSLLGSVRTDPRQGGFGTHLYTYLTAGFLAEQRADAAAVGVNVQNAVAHLAAAVTQFWLFVESAQAAD